MKVDMTVAEESLFEHEKMVAWVAAHPEKAVKIINQAGRILEPVQKVIAEFDLVSPTEQPLDVTYLDAETREPKGNKTFISVLALNNLRDAHREQDKHE